MSTRDYKVWYYENKADYELFLRKTAALIRLLLNSKDISHVIVQYRLKDLKGFLKKAKQLRGFNPKKVNDLAGIRVICYRVSQIKLIEQLFKSNFRVLKIDDKLKDLGTDKMGYHALHIDATHTKRRVSLPEYGRFKDFIFEIQICTSLRHTWNEIEHERKYKIGVTLPDDLVRQINKMSVMIDRTDKQLDKFSNDVDKLLKSHIKDEQLRKPIFSSNLGHFITQYFRGLPKFEPSFGKSGGEDVIEELNSIGIKTISDLKRIIPKNLKQIYRKITKEDDHLTYSLIIREIMILHNAKDYFDKAWKESHFDTLDNHSYRVLKEFNIPVVLPEGLEWEG